MSNKILVIGGAGYVGSSLVPKLVSLGHEVVVYDLCLFGSSIDEKDVKLIKGDVRDIAKLERALTGVEVIIHLACVSNDPSFEVDPQLSKTINLDCFEPLIEACVRKKVGRFIYASSSSVYGIQNSVVNEKTPLFPLTDYSKYKVECEIILKKYASQIETVILRPATVCGVSPRQRFDLVVNLLCAHAAEYKKIQVLGGPQLRPNIHIQDMVELYCLMVSLPASRINGKIYNYGERNYPVIEIGQKVQELFGNDVELVTVPTDDHRSYHISSELIKDELGVFPKKKIEDGIIDIRNAIESGSYPDLFKQDKYFNVRVFKSICHALKNH